MASFNTHEPGDDGWSEWILPLPGFKLACCTCGLVHDVEFKIDSDGEIVFRVRINNRSTAAVRREEKKRGEQKNQTEVT